MKFRKAVCLPLKSILDSSEDIWIKRNVTVWLLRLAEFEIEIDDNFFSCCGWIAGGDHLLASNLFDKLNTLKGRSREMLDARQAIKALGKVTRGHECKTIERLYVDNPVIRNAIVEFCLSYLQKWLCEHPKKGKSIFPRSFSSLFNLDAKALEFCSFVWALSNFSVVEYYFEDCLLLCNNQNFPMLARMLKMSYLSFKRMLSNLNHLGIITINPHTSLRLTDNLAEALTRGALKDLRTFFCRTVPSTDVQMQDFRLPEDEKRHILALMRQKNSRPAHLLLYGAPGTGKTSFASCIVHTLGVEAWTVACHENDTVKDRHLALMACVHLSDLHPGSIIVVDEAERILDTDNAELEGSSSKAWLNDFLERKGLRIIWITNMVSHIDQAVRRRFSFSAHFDMPGKRECLTMWNKVASRAKVENLFPAESREKFAKFYQVPVAVMENAVRQAKSLARNRKFSDCVERILKAHMALAQDGAPVRPRQSLHGFYNPALICASMKPGKLLEKLARLRERMNKETLRGMGNILFYGPSGTGKTAFAKNLANQLECEYIACKASDLISPYVGETEQRIASMFLKAEQEKALLIFDEADSFIFTRENVHHSWEQTMVNEFLTSLENFDGLCVCTTNFRKIMDGAAMRRFSFKIAFNYAGSAELRALYNLFLAPLSAQPVEEEIYKLLCVQKTLTPGDFQAVRSQFWLEAPENISHKAMLETLLAEEAQKLGEGIKNIGF